MATSRPAQRYFLDVTVFRRFPENLYTQMRFYQECMEDVQFRLLRARRMLRSQPDDTQQKIRDLELISLDVRKSIEMIAFASIVANQEQYCAVYPKFKDHWNAKLIFSDLERINSKFFPVPFDLAYEMQMVAPSRACLSKDGAIELHALTNRYLHARNVYALPRDVDQDHHSFLRGVDELVGLLSNFEVRLLPESYLYFVSVTFDEPHVVNVVLAEFRD